MDIDIDFKSGKIEKKIYGNGKVDKIVAGINLKAFYKDLHEALVNSNFKDILNDPDGGFFDYQTKKGEYTDNKANLNRTGDMFEKKFIWIKKDNGNVDLEFEWYAKKESVITQHGRFEVKIYLVCRNIEKIEKLVGNNKVKLDSGGWEFRNEIVYKNSVISDFLHKIPFVKNSPILQEMYINFVYGGKIKQDINYGETRVFSAIYSVIDKHFNSYFVK